MTEDGVRTLSRQTEYTEKDEKKGWKIQNEEPNADL